MTPDFDGLEHAGCKHHLDHYPEVELEYPNTGASER